MGVDGVSSDWLQWVVLGGPRSGSARRLAWGAETLERWRSVIAWGIWRDFAGQLRRVRQDFTRA